MLWCAGSSRTNNSARDWLYAVEDFDGLSGRLSCDVFGDCGAARFNVVRLEDPRVGLEGLFGNVVYSSRGAKSVPGRKAAVVHV